MRTRRIAIGLVSVVMLIVLAVVFLPRLRKPKQVLTQSYWPTNGWRTSTPEEQGFDSAKLAESLQDLQQKQIPIDSLLIIRNGYVVLDAYFYPYEASFPHNLESVTKSITTALVAIAAEQGKLQLDKPMVAYFPNRTIANLDERKKSISVRHLAGMVNGMSSGCLAGDVSTLEALRSTPDWVQAALDREMTTEPGKVFCYDSPGMHLLSAILQETTGMTELEFARKYLFEPLGIQDVYWESDPQGYTHGWADLWLKPPDAAKIGYLFLNHGVWEGKQIVPSAWVTEAVKMQNKTGTIDDYGYGWWVANDSYFAAGHFGQYIRVYPAENVVVVITARGFDHKTIEPVLGAAHVSPDKPLPANPQGLAKLNALLSELPQGKGSEPVVSSPALAREVSGKTYDCEPNGVDVTRMRIEFNDPAEAKLYISKKDSTDVIWPIGLDGKYRMCSEWKGLRGYWQDAQTFNIQFFYNLGPLNRQWQFEENQMVVSLPDMGLKFTCHVQNP